MKWIKLLVESISWWNKCENENKEIFLCFFMTIGSPLAVDLFFLHSCNGQLRISKVIVLSDLFFWSLTKFIWLPLLLDIVSDSIFSFILKFVTLSASLSWLFASLTASAIAALSEATTVVSTLSSLSESKYKFSRWLIKVLVEAKDSFTFFEESIRLLTMVMSPSVPIPQLWLWYIFGRYFSYIFQLLMPWAWNEHIVNELLHKSWKSISRKQANCGDTKKTRNAKRKQFPKSILYGRKVKNC